MVFTSDGVPLAGTFFRDSASLSERQRCVVVTGSWLNVKEQMALVYARALAERGFTAFTFAAGAQRRLRATRQREGGARATGGQETARLDRQWDPDRFLRCTRIREDRRRPRRRLVRGDFVSLTSSRAMKLHSQAVLVFPFASRAESSRQRERSPFRR
jgi:hypothetical protein